MRYSEKASLLAGAFMAASLLAAPGSGLAQSTSGTTPPATPPPPKSDKAATEVTGVVITGSRIKQTNYNSPSPITVITSEDAALTGSVDTGQLLQLSAVANNSQQINNFFTGYNVTGGPGVNTLSLRGIGAQRTLILLDGQRVGPAGVGGTVGPIDLNTIPESMIDRVEILNDGASSIYGSDAVAGVVNIITKKSYDGADLHVYGQNSEQGGGGEYEVNGNIGKTFDKGYVSAGFDFYRQEALTYGQRGYFSCARDLTTVPGTSESADVTDPATGSAKCWNEFAPAVIDLADGQTYRSNSSAVLGGGLVGADLPGFQAVGLYGSSLTQSQVLASAALIPYAPPQYLKSDAISPVNRYTFNMAGGLDLTPHAQLYGTLLLNQRDSSQLAVPQFYGYLNPQTDGNATAGFGFPEPVLPYYDYSSQQVNYYRAVAGVKGDLPSFSIFNNWTYDLYGQASLSRGNYTQTYAPTDRVNAVLGAGPGANGCDPTAMEPYGTGLTMAQAEPGVACIPFNLIADVANGGLTPAEEAFLYRTATGHTSYDQYYLEGSTNGTVFQLPAGPLGASIGFQVRRESIDDTPPPDFVNGNVYNLTTAGVTKGSEDAQEVFGELQVPVIKSFPLVKSFDLNVSGRVSHYSNYGTNGTFKFGVNWKVTDWLAFRATDGSAYRAPALYEQYLANQSGYESQDSIDPCIKWGTTGVSATIIANCKAAGITSPTYDGSAPGSGGSNYAEVFTGGGPGLKPETSQSQTVGIVFTPTWHDLDLKVAATYYSFHVENQIQQFGAANILYQCYDSKTYPNSPFCSLFTRDSDPTSSTYLQITQVKDDYVNVAEDIDQGLDVDITYITHLPADVKMTIDSHLDWTFYTNTILLGGQTNNYLGQVGQPAFEGNLNFKFDKGPWTVNYYIYFVGKSSDNDFVGNINNDYLLSGETVQYNHVVPFYSDSAVSVRRKFDTFTVEVGVKNLFDTPPPYYSTGGFQYRTGVVPLASQYDWIGRSVFIDLRKKF